MTILARLQKLVAIVMAVATIPPGVSTAQPGPDSSDWQRTKCEICRQSWDKALDFFGSDNLNYNFIAQNENFIASGCTAPPSISPVTAGRFEFRSHHCYLVHVRLSVACSQ